MPISFNTTYAEHELILLIVRRAGALYTRVTGEDWLTSDHRRLMMDLSACQAGICRLDLHRLLAARDGDFAHDVFGISRHLDREEGVLTGHFLPRFASREAAA